MCSIELTYVWTDKTIHVNLCKKLRNRSQKRITCTYVPGKFQSMPDVQTSWIHIFPWIVCMQQRNLFADSSPVKWWYNFYAFKKPENRTLPSCHSVSHFAAWNSLKNLEMGPLGLWDQCTKNVWKRDVFGISWYNLATTSLTGKSDKKVAWHIFGICA